MNINYIPCGDYLIPEFAIALETESLGKYGRMRHTYLREHCPGLYQQLVLSGRLRAHLLVTERTCRERMERIISRIAEGEGIDEQLTEQMKNREGITEHLKAEQPMVWIGRMNSIRSSAEEIVREEIINSL